MTLWCLTKLFLALWQYVKLCPIPLIGYYQRTNTPSDHKTSSISRAFTIPNLRGFAYIADIKFLLNNIPDEISFLHTAAAPGRAAVKTESYYRHDQIIRIFCSKSILFRLSDLRHSKNYERAVDPFSAPNQEISTTKCFIFITLQSNVVWRTINPFSWIFHAIAFEKYWLISMPFRLTYTHFRSVKFLTPADSRLVNSNSRDASLIQGWSQCMKIANLKAAAMLTQFLSAVLALDSKNEWLPPYHNICPKRRKESRVPSENLNMLPTSFRINSLLDVLATKKHE